MGHMERDDFIAGRDDLILVTGATGFIGTPILLQGDRGQVEFRKLVVYPLIKQH